MHEDPDPTSSNGEASGARVRKRAQSMFRSMLLMFTIGFGVFAVVVYIETKEVVVVFLVAFTYLGGAVFGWLGQRWLLRNIGGDG